MTSHLRFLNGVSTKPEGCRNTDVEVVDFIKASLRREPINRPRQGGKHHEDRYE